MEKRVSRNSRSWVRADRLQRGSRRESIGGPGPALRPAPGRAAAGEEPHGPAGWAEDGWRGTARAATFAASGAGQRYSAQLVVHRTPRQVIRTRELLDGSAPPWILFAFFEYCCCPNYICRNQIGAASIPIFVTYVFVFSFHEMNVPAFF